MISNKALFAYMQAFKDSTIGYAEPSDVLVIEDNNGKIYRVDIDNDDAFLDLIKKSKEQKKNLFLDPKLIFNPYPDDVTY